LIYDCLDRSDEPYGERFETYVNDPIAGVADEPICSRNPSISCEEFFCHYLQIVCGNGLCMPPNNNDHSIWYCLNENDRQTWFNALNENNSLNIACWQALICVMELRHIDSSKRYNDACTDVCLNHRPIRRSVETFPERRDRALDCAPIIKSRCLRDLFTFPRWVPGIPFPLNVT
jgi:hypothetical protein